jgi:hypothetical protein
VFFPAEKREREVGLGVCLWIGHLSVVLVVGIGVFVVLDRWGIRDVKFAVDQKT